MIGHQVRFPERTNELACELAKVAGTKVGEVLEDAVDLLVSHVSMAEQGQELIYRDPKTGQETKVSFPGYEKYKKGS